MSKLGLGSNSRGKKSPQLRGPTEEDIKEKTNSVTASYTFEDICTRARNLTVKLIGRQSFSKIWFY